MKKKLIFLALILMSSKVFGQFNPHSYYISHKPDVKDRSGDFEAQLNKNNIQHFSMPRSRPKDTLLAEACSIKTLRKIFIGRGYSLLQGMWEISILIDGNKLTRDKDKNMFILESGNDLYAVSVYWDKDRWVNRAFDSENFFVLHVGEAKVGTHIFSAK